MRLTATSIILIIASLLTQAQAQEVWPGDVNNNGEVNAVDLLYWGVAFGSEGPARSEVNTTFMPWAIDTLWGQDFPFGPNYAYADCDGNGLVDENDYDDAIEDNFGLTHGTVGPDFYANAAPGSAPALRLEPTATLVEEGAMVDIIFSLDPGSEPLSQFYGIALKVSYTTGLLNEDDGPDFDLAEDSWIESDNSLVKDIYVDDDGMGQAQLAITRTNQVSVPAQSDEMGRFSIIVEDIIVGLEVDTFIIRIDSVLLIGPDLMSIPVTPDTAAIVIVKDIKTVTETIEESASQLADATVIFPNPARDHLTVMSKADVVSMRMYNSLGQLVRTDFQRLDPQSVRISLEGLRPGPYLLMIKSGQGVFTKRIIRLGG